jgi:putative ABC transport system permease protein
MPRLSQAAALAGAEARPWTSYAKEAIDHAANESVFYWIFLAILLLLSGEAVTSTMRAAVRERTREIASMRATGWSRREVFTLFALESSAIGVAGSAAGAAVGGGLSALLEAFPFDISSMGSMIDYPFFAMTSSSRPGDFILAIAAGAVAAFLAGAAPARAAARTNIARALSTH